MLSTPNIDWLYMRSALLAPLVALGVAVALLAASYVGRARITAESVVARQELASLDQQRLDLASRLEARRRYGERFESIAQAGIVGAEQRLAWAEALRLAAKKLHLPYLRYSASPQQPFAVAYLVPGEAAQVNATAMELQAGLVHEGDLLRLFEVLRDQAPGLFSVTGCALERAGGTATAPEPDRANITGTCELRWFSIPMAATAPVAEDQT